MAKLILVLNFLVFPMASENQTGYQSWKHSGSLFILTNPDGANLPQGASVHNFPLLIRLHKDFFDFQQANNQGADIRFSTISGIPLAYQIEQWDPENAHAAIWVRIPKIEGNTTQEIKIHWGNPAATSESDGKRVFNAENGYLGVWHMGQTNQDEVGAMGCVDTGTTQATGMVGQARHFPGQKGIVAGEKITTLPTGSNPHTTEAWFRAEKINNQVMAWGNEQGQGKVVMRFRSPPSVKMECYFSGADVVNKTPLAMNQWIHVAHTYQKGESRVYVNGLLDGQSITQSAPLAIKTPARLFIGGWYNNYDFVGDIDEVRISNKVRSPEWIRLQFENQKTNQSLVGPIVQSGNQFAVFPTKLEISEGKNATLRATAPGARKIYWSIQRDGKEEIASVDRLSLAFAPGRVVGDQSATIRCKAVYPDKVKTAEIPVKIIEAIPEPHFSLKLPPLWNGRDTIELAPTIHNLQALRAKSADSLQFQWKATGMAVIQQVAPGRLILKRSQNSGPLTISLTVSNGGAESTRSGTIQVTQPESDPWLMRSPEPDEKPEQGQFFPRDDKNQGTLFYNGRLDQPADEVYLKLFANDLPFNSQTQKVPPNRAYNFTVKLKPGLIKYRVEFGIQTPTGGKILNTVDDLVCGDAYLIQGQSNALATDTNEKSPPDTNDWIRSYGGKSGREDATTWVHDQFTKAKANGSQRPNLWCKPVWKAEQGEKAELGWWGMVLANRLVTSQKIPVCIINGAVGGTRIDEHQPSDDKNANLRTIYGRALWRVQQARLTHGIRAVLWHQGESDQGADGPTLGYGWETYQSYFLNLAAAWKEDMPNIQHYYLFQIWPNACSMGNGQGDKLREVQRQLPLQFSNLSIMSTVGIKPPGGCHFPLIGWAEFARLIQPLIERDLHGSKPQASISPPNLQRVFYNSPAQNSITMQFDQPVVWQDSLLTQFYCDGKPQKEVTATVSGNAVTLNFKTPPAAKTISYLKEMQWNQDNLLRGTSGIAALTFCEVEINKAPPVK